MATSAHSRKYSAEEIIGGVQILVAEAMPLLLRHLMQGSKSETTNLVYHSVNVGKSTRDSIDNRRSA
jgi:hypothetical protein